MPVPNLPGKLDEQPIFSAADLLADRRRKLKRPDIEPLDGLIIAYQKHLVEEVIRRLGGKEVKGWDWRLHLLETTGHKVGAVMGFGIGAPMAAILLEDFVASGVRRFITVGIAGGLQDGMQTGDLVVAERAIRDEGTSYHYLPDAKYASASPELTRHMIEAARRRGAVCQAGTAWTTDAPYRETRTEIAQYRAEGVLAVDMEAAALFAVGERLSVEVCVAFAIADAIHEGGWRVDYDAQKARAGVQTLFESAVEVLAE